MKSKIFLLCSILLCGCFFFTACSTADMVSKEEHEQKIAELDTSIKSLQNDKTKLEKEKKELETKNKELQAQVDKAKPWFELSEQEQKEKEAELQRKKEQEEAEKKAKEEEERKAKEAQAEAERLAKEEEEKRGYDTGISFEQLARTPDQYEGKKVKFSGEVLQVLEGDGEVEIRLAVNNDYNAVILGAYESSIVSSRVLEDDYITIMGISGGLYTYESTMGAQITVPFIYIEKIEN